MKDRLIVILVSRYGQKIKIRFIALVILSVVNGFLEVAGIGLIFPLISLVANPNLVMEKDFIVSIYNFFNFQSVNSLIYLFAIIVGLTFVIKNLFMILFQYLQFNLVKRWIDDISGMMMQKYLYAPYIYHLKRTSSSLINNLSYTIPYVMHTYVISFIMLLANTIVISMLLLIVVYLFPIPSLISGLVLVILISVQARYIKNYTKKISKVVVTTKAEYLSLLSQSLIAIKETKSFLSEGYFFKKFTSLAADSSDQDQRSLVIQNIPAYANEIVLMTSVVTMCCLVLGNAAPSSLTIANLAVLAAVAFRVAPIANRALRAYSQVKVSSDATYDFIREIEAIDLEINLDNKLRDDVVINPLDFKKCIELKEINFEYNLNEPVLKGVSLKINKGEFVGIVGSSGSGKTTLVDIVLTLLQSNSGEYIIDDRTLVEDDLLSLRKIIGYVGQQPFIFNGSIAENVAFGVERSLIDENKVIESLRKAQILDFFKSKDSFLDYEIADFGKSLSGGQKQRVAFARALYNDPEIIILDEATSALDVETEKGITDVINGLKGDVTIIAVAHRLSTLKECTEVIYMDKGKVLDIGNFKDLENRHDSFSNLIKLSSV